MLSAVATNAAQTAATTKTGPDSSANKSHKTAPTSPVDLNNATQAELQSVPGIGASTAKKIIAGRPYSSVSDLSKAGLSSKQVQGFSSMVKVGPAPARNAVSSPQPSPQPSSAPLPTASTNRSSPRASTTNAASSSAAPAPGGGTGMVWVNTETKVFHRQGDKWYGKTKKGKYMKEADALQAGYHASKES